MQRYREISGLVFRGDSRLALAGTVAPIAINQSLIAPYTNCLTSLR
jgi:hypothetical protein